MKNKKGFLSLVLLIILSLSMVTANAGEVTERAGRNSEFKGMSFEERLDARMAEITERLNGFLDTRTENYNERVADSMKKTANKLETIETIAPDFVDEFQQAADDHALVHSLLFNEAYAKQEVYVNETLAGLDALEIEVLAAVEAETMTPQEAAIMLKEYLTAQRDEYVATKDAYKAEIAPLDEANEASKLIVQDLREDLKIAVEAGDSESIESILTELLSWSAIHLEYDYAKLEILSTY